MRAALRKKGPSQHGQQRPCFSAIVPELQLSCAQGITIADPNLPDCPLMYVNAAFCRMTGYDREEIIGRNCRFLQGPETDRAAVARIRAAMEQVCTLDNPPRNAAALVGVGACELSC
jgi:PAS domain-containing protein